jgi:serine/threonine-protein kinase
VSENEHSRVDRSTLVARLKSEPLWDLAVIGGGATGLGVAVDAALPQRLGEAPDDVSQAIGALVAGLVFFAKAGILSGAFYVQAAALFATALVMCKLPEHAHIVFGLVSAACFFVPGLKYFRQRMRAD